MDIEPIFGEPIFNITKPLAFIIYSIPSIEKLDIHHDTLSENDIILGLDDIFLDRINFECTIAPWNYDFKNDIPMISIRYNKLFSLSIFLRSFHLPIQGEMKDCFNFIAPSMGVYSSPIYDKSEAILFFHQAVMNTSNVIIYSPNNQGIYRMIFSVPMRIPPKINITFEEKDLSVELLEFSRTNARFKVKDKYGQTIKKESKIGRVCL